MRRLSYGCQVFIFPRTVIVDMTQRLLKELLHRQSLPNTTIWSLTDQTILKIHIILLKYDVIICIAQCVGALNITTIDFEELLCLCCLSCGRNCVEILKANLELLTSLFIIQNFAKKCTQVYWRYKWAPRHECVSECVFVLWRIGSLSESVFWIFPIEFDPPRPWLE